MHSSVLMFDPVLIDTVTRILSFNVFGSYFNGRVLVRGLRSSKRRVSWRLGAITVKIGILSAQNDVHRAIETQTGI
jgi:hypothetical protein